MCATTIIPPPLTNPGSIPATPEQRGAEAGRAAFLRGDKRIPALDPAMSVIIHDLSGPVVRNSPVTRALTAWLKAWDDANLFRDNFGFNLGL